MWRGSEPLSTPTERAAFEAAQLPYIEPHQRSERALLRALGRTVSDRKPLETYTPFRRDARTVRGVNR